MGTWGVGIYQNDISADVKEDYIAKLKSGKSDEVALKEILSEYQEDMEDIDCKYDFYFGLADTLWKKGRLTEKIKTIALQLIEEDRVSQRWQTERIRYERSKVLDKLKVQLEETMPEYKKIPVHKPYVLGWEEGDVYFFQIKEKIESYEKYLGWYALFYVNKIYLRDWNVNGVADEVADVYFFLTKDKPESIDALRTSKRVCFHIGKTGNRYRMHIYESSRRNRPKDLTLLGKCDGIHYPLNNSSKGGHFCWSRVDIREILYGYENQLKLDNED